VTIFCGQNQGTFNLCRELQNPLLARGHPRVPDVLCSRLLRGSQAPAACWSCSHGAEPAAGRAMTVPDGGARYVLVFQDGSRHALNLVPGRKFTIGQCRAHARARRRAHGNAVAIARRGRAPLPCGSTVPPWRGAWRELVLAVSDPSGAEADWGRPLPTPHPFLGRAPECDISVRCNQYISDTHCEFEIAGAASPARGEQRVLPGGGRAVPSRLRGLWFGVLSMLAEALRVRSRTLLFRLGFRLCTPPLAF